MQDAFSRSRVFSIQRQGGRLSGGACIERREVRHDSFDSFKLCRRYDGRGIKEEEQNVSEGVL